MIGRTNVGGGDNLNFKIVGGTTQPGAGGDTLTWDGNAEGLVSVDIMNLGTPTFYRVTEDYPPLSAAANGMPCVVTFTDGSESLTVSATDLSGTIGVEAYGIGMGSTFFGIAFSQDVSMSDTENYKKGLYFWCGVHPGLDNFYCYLSSITIPGYTGFGGSAAPKENTIWVNTDKVISGWVFSATEPSGPVEGMVWIKTGYTSPAAFNAIKKNNVMVYPLGCYQYINGAWVKNPAKSYIGGEWKPWAQYLFDGGDECASVTGGWTASAIKPTSSHNTASKPTVTKTNADITVEITSGSGTGGGLFHTNNKIDLTPYSTLHMSVTACQGQRKDLVIPDDLNAGWEDDPRVRYNETSVPTVMSLDVSNINESRYVAIGLAYNQAQTASKVPVGVTIDKIWLE